MAEIHDKCEDCKNVLLGAHVYPHVTALVRFIRMWARYHAGVYLYLHVTVLVLFVCRWAGYPAGVHLCFCMIVLVWDNLHLGEVPFWGFSCSSTSLYSIGVLPYPGEAVLMQLIRAYHVIVLPGSCLGEAVLSY